MDNFEGTIVSHVADLHVWIAMCNYSQATEGKRVSQATEEATAPAWQGSKLLSNPSKLSPESKALS